MIDDNWIDCPNCKQGHLSPLDADRSAKPALSRELKAGFLRCDNCQADAPQEYSAGFWALVAVNAVGFLVDSGDLGLLTHPQQYLDQNALKPPTMAMMVYFKICWWEAAIEEVLPGAVVEWIDSERARQMRP